MNYKLIYEQLVTRGQQRAQLEGYKERHHIRPKCMCGGDEDENLVDLTPEEHFLAHQLLVKMYPGNIRLVRACDVMAKDTKVNKYWRRNKMYGWLRRRLHVPEIDIDCAQCGVTFQTLECRGRKFCSVACKHASQVRNATVCCKGCEKDFETKASKSKNIQYCTRECADKWRYIHSGQSVKWTCLKCSKEMYVNKNIADTKKYCSRTCQYS